MPSVRTKVLKVQFGVGARPLSKAEQLRQDRAYEIDHDDALGMVVEMPYGFSVASFEGGTSYRVAELDGVIKDCSCEDHQRTHLVCKHMHLAARVTTSLILYGGRPLPERAGLGALAAIRGTADVPQQVNHNARHLAAAEGAVEQMQQDLAALQRYMASYGTTPLY